MGGKESFETSVDNIEKARKPPKLPTTLALTRFAGLPNQVEWLLASNLRVSFQGSE